MTSFPRIVCRVKAIYPFHSEDPASLHFDKDDLIDVLAQLDSGWWDGWCGGARGWFPSNYVEVITENPDTSLRTTEERPWSPVTANRNSTLLKFTASKRPEFSDTRRRVISRPTQYNPKIRPKSSSPVTVGRGLGWTGNPSTPDEIYGTEYKLPEGWSVHYAEDNSTCYYYNHRTGKSQFEHPGQPLSDDDYDSDYENRSLEESCSGDEDFHSTTPRLSNTFSNRLSIDSLPADAEIPETDHLDASQKPITQWVERVTPQGRLYYCNLATHETTWDYNEIDKKSGRLYNIRNSDPEGENTTDHAQESTTGAVFLELPDILETQNNNLNKVEPLTWDRLTGDITTAIYHLNAAAQRDERDILMQHMSAIVVAVRSMLYASDTLDKDSYNMQDQSLREPHRAVMAALSKLVLSVKGATGGSDCNAIETLPRVERDAGDVLTSVKAFVNACQEKHILVENVNPQLARDDILTAQLSHDAILPNNASITVAEPRASRRISLNSQPYVQKAKYPLNQDLLVSLQTHAKQILGSTEALHKATLFMRSTDTEEDEKYNLMSNVIFLFQSLSMQIGQYLSILEDIDLFSVDSANIPSLADFRVNKQSLYNAIGLLFSAVQNLSIHGIELSMCGMSVDDAVRTVEATMEKIYSSVDGMVKERKNYYCQLNPRRNGMPASPVVAGTLRTGDGLSDDEDDIGKAPTEAARKKMIQQFHRPSEDKSPGWAFGYDYSSEEIVFGSCGNVKGGTLRALVERLTLHDTLDTNFIATFLLTYRSFCTTDEFLTLLEERYNLQPKSNLTPCELEAWTERKQKLVRLRVFNVMKTWLENYYIEEDEFALSRLEFFTNTVIRDASSFSADQLNRLIRKRKEIDANGGGLKKLVPNSISSPLPILPKDMSNFSLMDIDPVELARQLTLLDYKLYSSIRPTECLNKAWSREDAGGNIATNVKQSIDYCNRLTCWVTDSILSNDESRRRVMVIKYWAQVAMKCRSFNNYNTCMAIISAFDNSAIGRLKKTWELVGSRVIQSLGNIRKLMGANRNFQEYREMIHSVNPPCIPFLGIYLQDLTFIEDGNADYIQKSAGLINFAKRQKTAEVIREINQFQSPPYTFQFIPQLQAFIKEKLLASQNVDTLYERSLQIEPRETTAT
ncbi:hypothetical protein BX666DRAFT_1971820 [Dichotomocladium elegans]|nr:hypothetical protein BX666DRAFT_1971820 [Dichotomocladium elegans]